MADEVTINLVEFTADLEKFAEQIDVDLVTVEKRVGFGVYTKLVVRTPVDTGRARANWNLSIETPDETLLPEGQYSSYQGDPTGTAQARAEQELGSLQKPVIIYITNPLPYIVPLNQGHSKQAPAGFVEIVVAEEEAGILSLTESE